MTTLYHGTNSNFSTFDFAKAGTVTGDMSVTGGLGAWFTDDLEYAKCYARNAAYNGGEAIILVAEIDAGCFDNTWTESDVEVFCERNGCAAARSIIEAEGHNGIVSYTDHGAEYCAFSAESIISITIM